jgi:ABC-2 type transport system ATP-binding protein
VIRVDGLTKRYGALTAIKNVSFTVQPGEVRGLLGPNGSGKSTTVKILTGLLQPTTGRVELDGRDALADLPAYQAQIGTGWSSLISVWRGSVWSLESNGPNTAGTSAGILL